MSLVRQRMIHPPLLNDPGLSPIQKRLVYAAAMMLAEDSGCLPWNARTLRYTALPYETDIVDEDVAKMMVELEEDGYAWPYEVNGSTYAYLPAFPEWSRSLTRFNAPHSVPLPDGISYEEIESKNRWGSCRYSWPKSKREMQGNQSTSQPVSLPSSLPISLGTADSLPAACDQPVLEGQPCLCVRADGTHDPDCKICGGTGLKPPEVPW